jgi:hypothetical protein
MIVSFVCAKERHEGTSHEHSLPTLPLPPLRASASATVRNTASRSAMSLCLNQSTLERDNDTAF